MQGTCGPHTSSHTVRPHVAHASHHPCRRRPPPASRRYFAIFGSPVLTSPPSVTRSRRPRDLGSPSLGLPVAAPVWQEPGTHPSGAPRNPRQRHEFSIIFLRLGKGRAASSAFFRFQPFVRFSHLSFDRRRHGHRKWRWWWWGHGKEEEGGAAAGSHPWPPGGEKGQAATARGTRGGRHGSPGGPLPLLVALQVEHAGK